ncbi:MAG: hypothetical protein ACI90U_000018 [Pseudomonadales bacterium]|jgi:hypothetical protein
MKELMIGGYKIEPGSVSKIELPVAKLYTDADVSLPIKVLEEKKMALRYLLVPQYMAMN